MWADGELVDEADLSPELSDRVAASLGISPLGVVVVGGRADDGGERVGLLEDHVGLLVVGAERLGYDGDIAPAVRDALDGLEAGTYAVAVLPGPSVRKAGPPGADWRIAAWPAAHALRGSPGLFGSGGRLGPSAVSGRAHTVRVAVCEYARNHRSGVADLLLLHDAEIEVGRRVATSAGADAALWCNTDGDVCGIDQGAVFAAVDGALVTPSVRSGCIDTAWRRAVIAGTGALERRVQLDEVLSSPSVGFVGPDGSVATVAVLGGHDAEDSSTADELRRALRSSTGARTA